MLTDPLLNLIECCLQLPVEISLQRFDLSEPTTTKRCSGLAALDLQDVLPCTVSTLRHCLPLTIPACPMDQQSKWSCNRGAFPRKKGREEDQRLTFTLAFNRDQSQFQPAALSHELAQIHAYWEDSLYAVTAFPGANEKNWRVLVMIEQIVEDRKLLGSGNNADKRALVEVNI